MPSQHPKRTFLEAVGALHLHPEHVRAPLFLRHRFFDPLDKVQVKYEMLRAHAVDAQRVTAVVREFGFSRETFYATWRDFQALGVVGLADEKRGRRGPLKLTPDAVRWIETLLRAHPELSGQEIADRLAAERGIEVHRRTIERLLAAGVKKNR
jgi:transposase